MQRKQLLVAACAAAMGLGLATQANALSLVYATEGVTQMTDISNTSSLTNCGSSPVGSPPCTYLDGTEGIFSPSGQQGVLSMDLTFSNGSLPSGNELLTVSLNSPYTFGANFNAGNVTYPAGCTTATAVLVGGGTAGSNQVQLLLSNSSASCIGSLHLEIPVHVAAPSTTNPVQVTATLVDPDSTPNIPIDGGTAVYQYAITFVQGLTASSTPELQVNGPTSGYSTYASLMDFRELGPNSLLGNVTLNLAPNVHFNLISNNLFTNAMVQSSELDVIGGYTTINGYFNPRLAGPGTLSTSGPLHACNDSSGTDCYALGSGGPWTYDVGLYTMNGLPVIQPSPYTATVTATLQNSVWVSGNPFVVPNLPLNQLGRQGAFIEVPWVTSPAVAALPGGSANLIRISNFGSTPTGPLLVEVLTSQCHSETNGTNAPPVTCTTDPVTSANNPLKLTASIAPGGDYIVPLGVITAALGEFANGDLKFTIVADPRTVSIKRLVMRNNNISEVSLGSWADGVSGSIALGEQDIAPAALQANGAPVTTNNTIGTTDGGSNGANVLNPNNTTSNLTPTSVPNQAPPFDTQIIPGFGPSF